jgi:hypothetical protein
VIPKAISVIAAMLVSSFVVTGAALSRDSASPPNGTYRTTFTADQLRGPGVGPKQRRENAGTWTLTLADGKWRLALKATAPGNSGVLAGSYSGSGQTLAFLHLRWVSGVKVPAPVVKIVWTRHPWNAISS